MIDYIIKCHAQCKQPIRSSCFSRDQSFLTMSLPRCFTLIGDSNVRRHMNPTNCRDRPLMSGCQVLPCTKLSLLAESLKAIRSESTVCVLSCLTNFIASSSEAGAVSHRVVPILQDVLQAVNEAAQSTPGRNFLISPPMYRKTPLWYRDGMPEIMTKFSEIMSGRRESVYLMSSFPNPVLEDDGVHLSLYSGLEFVLHLFDEATSVLDSIGSSVSVATSKTSEASRVLQDRVMAIEQDHRRLNLAFETKFAEDSELFDFHENLRMEDWFVISGLARLPQGLSPKDWQSQTVKDVQGIITLLLKKDLPIVYVQNNTGRHKDAVTKYFVQMRSSQDSAEIRDTFGAFFVGGEHRPAELKHVSIRNRVTPATLGRVAILRVFGERYLASNPGAKVQTIGYKPRPLLKLTPPASASSDSRIQTYNFIQAVNSLPANFTSDEQAQILREISPKLYGRLRQTFVVISDDMVKKRSKGRSGSGRNAASGNAADGDAEADADGDATARSPASGSSGRGRGSNRGRGSRNGKRGPSPIPGGAEKHRK